jgi:hypothetical protein
VNQNSDVDSSLWSKKRKYEELDIAPLEDKTLCKKFKFNKEDEERGRPQKDASQANNSKQPS